jgi:protein-S-isoprenylcysteine O-methyltransferase Ste14
MISGVSAMLIGEATIAGSRVLTEWALAFIAFNHLHFLLIEEPGLQRRFGESYLRYKAAVPRWLPRLTPYIDA